MNRRLRHEMEKCLGCDEPADPRWFYRGYPCCDGCAPDPGQQSTRLDTIIDDLPAVTSPKPRFLIDVDDVLAAFTDRIVPMCERFLGRELVPGGVDGWDLFANLNHYEWKAVQALMAQPGFCGSLTTTQGSWQGVSMLAKHCEVFAVTKPNCVPNWANERELWLNEKFCIPPDHVIQTGAKYMIRGDYFLDDRPDHVTRWAKENPEGKSMLWSTDHNEGIKGYDAHRVCGWDEVLAQVV